LSVGGTKQPQTQKEETPMIFTEKEVAKNGPLCPATNVKLPCQASRCMAWRWHSTKGETTKISGDPTTGVTFKYESGEKKGYCGLAGPPEVGA
jgi:hypothetical protein